MQILSAMSLSSNPSYSHTGIGLIFIADNCKPPGIPPVPRLAARKHDPILRRHRVVGSASGPRVDSAPSIADDLARSASMKRSISGRIRPARHIVSASTWLRPYLVQQARQPESGFRELMARDDLGMVHVRRAQIDLRFIAAQRGRWFTRLDWNFKRGIDVGTRDLIRLPRDIVGMSRNPRIERFLACVCLFQPARRRLGSSGIDASSSRRTMVVSQASWRFLARGCESTLTQLPPSIRVVRGMEGLMDVADKMDQERQIAGSAPSVVFPSFSRLEYSSILPVTQLPPGHRAGTSASPISQTNVDEVPGSRRSDLPRETLESGRIEAASIAAAI